MTTSHTSELHAVFATDGEHNTYRVSDVLSWGAAQREWTRLDDLRRAGRLPQAKFFEVRSVWLENDRPLVGPDVRSHDRYDNAPVDLTFTRPVVEGSKGYADEQWTKGRRTRTLTGAEKAARAAWKLHHPTFRVTTWDGKTVDVAEQGRGGWFYYPNGVTAAQGLRDLAEVCKRRGYVVKGADNRWYVFALEVL